MKKLTFPVIFLFCFLLSTYPLDDVTYPRKSASNTDFLKYYVPSDYPSIQSAVDAADAADISNITIIVEAGEYREAVVATGLRNLKLVGRNAKILPPVDFKCTDPPLGNNFTASSSLKLINCENFTVDGFTFIGDDFAESTRYSCPMSNSIHSYNSSGTISNNIIFNYFDGICFQVDNPRWMKGEMANNYIHNCIWSGIYATGSHNLKIIKNRITFTIPKEYSISVGIWADGGTGIISMNHITSYRAVDIFPQQKTLLRSDFWPMNLQFTEGLNYQIFDNTFEQTAISTQFTIKEMAAHEQSIFPRHTHAINNHFINVHGGNNNIEQADIVMLRPE